jgi:hypothetical protein
MKKLVWIGMVAAALAVGCVKTGSVVERTPVSSLSAYKVAKLEVDVASEIKNAEQTKSEFHSAIAERLKGKKVFNDVVADGGDVFIKVKVTRVTEANKGLQALGPANSGSAEVYVTVEMTDKDGKAVGAFDVTGNSKKNVQTKVGGVNTAAMEDSTNKALGAAADEIAGYLAQKTGAAP